MKRIGLIVAVEMDAVKNALKEPLWEEEQYGFNLSCYRLKDCELIVAHCGVGQLAASEASEYLILRYGVSMLFNFGVVGGLTEEISSTPFVFVKEVVHSDADLNFIDGLPLGQHDGYDSPYLTLDEDLLKIAKQTLPCVPLVRCASGDGFIGKEEDKRNLHRTFDADICDMELAGVVYCAKRFGVKVFSCKMVADSIPGGKEEFYEKKDETSAQCFDLLLKMEGLFKE